MKTFDMGVITDKGTIIDKVETNLGIIWITDALDENSFYEENLKIIHESYTNNRNTES